MQSMFISHLARSDSKVTIEISWNIMMCILWVNDVEFLHCISLAGIESVLGFLGWMHLYYLLWLRLVGTRWGVTESKPTPNSSTFNRIQSTYRPYRYVSKLKGRNLGGFPPNTSRILRHIHLLQTDKCRVEFPRDSLLQQEICGKGTDDSLNLKRHFSTQQKSDANRGK